MPEASGIATAPWPLADKAQAAPTPLTGGRRLRPFGSAGSSYAQAKNSRTSLTKSAPFSISGRWPH